MRIGLFTDTYRPSINGIVYVVDITRKHLEDLGHEVFIFCPSDSIRPNNKHEDDHIIHFPSFKGAFYEDYSFSLFFPPWVLRRIKELNLDVMHAFTPGQIGLISVWAANKYHIPLVMQHSTDVYEYVEHYPAALPGLLLLAPALTLTFRFDGKDARELLKIYRPRRGVNEWNKDIVEALISMIYSRADTVIALSRKSQRQLKSWMGQYSYPIKLIPTGIDALPISTVAQRQSFRKKYSIAPDDEIISYVGRLGAEKNLAILIPVIEKVLQTRPKARLLFVGDFEYRAELERLARNSNASERITFTGSLPRETLGQVYGNTDVFVFPSITDTQGLVLHEAAHAGCPLVIVDRGVSEVMTENENGYNAKNNPNDIAKKIVAILEDSSLKTRFSKASKMIAKKYTERIQVVKLVELYQSIINANSKETKEKRLHRLFKKIKRSA